VQNITPFSSVYLLSPFFSWPESHQVFPEMSHLSFWRTETLELATWEKTEISAGKKPSVTVRGRKV